MKRLACEICGSNDLVKDGGLFVCQACGCKYTVDEVKKMMIEGTVEVSGTVVVDNSGSIDNFLQMANNALDASNYAEAENYANKIIEINPQNAAAWFVKGKASGWQTTGVNNRYPESIVNWINAYQFSSEEEKMQMAQTIIEEARVISIAVLQMECKSFSGFRSEDNQMDVLRTVIMIREQLRTLGKKMGEMVYTSFLRNMMADIINDSVRKATEENEKDFGTEKRNRDQYSWKRYVGEQDRCLVLLKQAYELATEDSLCYSICSNYLSIGRKTKDSCSYTYNANTGGYVMDYYLTDQAKSIRNKTISDYSQKQREHSTNGNILEKIQTLCSETRGEEEKELAQSQYWEEHTDLKAALEKERDELNDRLTKNNAEYTNDPDNAEIKKIDSQISELKNHMNSLGKFKGKEKKSCQEKIDELDELKKPYRERWNEKSKRLDKEKNEALKRLKEIEKEFTCDRGPAKVPPAKTLELVMDGKYASTPEEIYEYVTAVLPQDISIKNGRDCITDPITRKKIDEFVSSMETFNKKVGNTQIDIDPFSYFPDLEYYDLLDDNLTHFIMHFMKNGKEVGCELRLSSNETNKPITGIFTLNLALGRKTPETVTDFIRISTSILRGICDDLNMKLLQDTIARVAVGIEKNYNNTVKITTEKVDIIISQTGKDYVSLEVLPAR